MGDLREYWQRVAARKKALGLDDPALTDRLRNSGEARTDAKREMLDRAEECAREAGTPPIPSKR